ncbi:MAG: leucine-rich repeat protein [Oscillospiraceae bacterium]|nr:leucine-rich repeat protein [Oscillospiraceae bacterium]
MKRLLALLLCLVMALSLIPAAAAEDIEIIEVVEPEEPITVGGTETAEAVPNASGSCGDNLTWTLDSSGTLTISGLGDMTDWSSADSVPWHGYTASITALSIGSGVSSIGDYAFHGCSRLTSVTIPDSVTRIWSYAFQECSSLESVTIGKNVTSIGMDAFYDCTALKSVMIPNSVTDIRRAAFCYCSSLESVLIGTGVTKIWSYAFYGCGRLTDVYYVGTKTQWNAITVESYNENLQRANMYYNCNTPEITGQPQDVSMAKYGDTVTLSVEAEGFALEYQWMSRVGANWLIISDAASPTYSFEIKGAFFGGGYSGAGEYRCKVSNSLGSVYSRTAVVTVDDTPTVIDQPQNVSAKAGDGVAFSVYAIGPNRSYQWYYRKSASDSWKKSTADSATTADLSITAESYRDGYQYRCKVSNAAGYAYSRAAKLTVVAKPSVTTQPGSQSAKEGETVKFTVAATGGGLKYQWYYRTSSTGEWKKSTGTGATTRALSVEAKSYRSGYQYRCRVSNAAGYKYSSAATLTVLTKPTITSQPSSKSVTAGTSVRFSVTATGGDLSYQWYYRTGSSGEWKKCTGTGATTRTLTVEAKSYRSGYQYRCKVSNEVGYKYSSAATLTVK